METIAFNKEAFPFLSMSEELIPGFQMLGESDLGDESGWLMYLCGLAGEPLAGELNADELLYVEADGDGILKRVYSPAVWYYSPTSEEDLTAEQPVLRVGNNLFPIKLDKGELSCGTLKADGFDFEILESNTKEKYLGTTVTFASEDGEMLFVLDVRLDGKKHSTKTDSECQKLKQEIKSALKKGTIADYLMVIGQGGGTTLKMEDLGSGEFLVEQITELDFMDSEDNPRVSYSLNLSNGDSVWAKGNVALILGDAKKRWQNRLVDKNLATLQTENLPGDRVSSILHLKQPVTLKIGEIKAKGQGFSVSCSLVERAPNVLMGDVGVAQLAPAKQPVKQLTAAVIDADVPF